MNYDAIAEAQLSLSKKIVREKIEGLTHKPRFLHPNRSHENKIRIRIKKAKLMLKLWDDLIG